MTYAQTTTSASAHHVQEPSREAPRELRMSRAAHREMLIELVSRPPETGGLLLGPIGSSDITKFHFDVSGRCTEGSYSPDHVSLNQMLKEVWIPSGIDFKGSAHSHPRGYDRLSPGDVAYIKRLLIKNTDMAVFAAPIILPREYRWLPFIVSRDAPDRPILANLVLF